FGGLDSSSRWISSSLRPPRTPPLPLISSMAMLSPRVIASPDWAEAPDRAATCPILTGSCAKAEPAAHDKRRAVASANPPSRHIEHFVHIRSLLLPHNLQSRLSTPATPVAAARPSK